MSKVYLVTRCSGSCGYWTERNGKDFCLLSDMEADFNQCKLEDYDMTFSESAYYAVYDAGYNAGHAAGCEIGRQILKKLKEKDLKWQG